MWKQTLSITLTALASVYAWSEDNINSGEGNLGVEHQSRTSIAISAASSGVTVGADQQGDTGAQTGLAIERLLPANSAAAAKTESGQGAAESETVDGADATGQTSAQQAAETGAGLESAGEAAVAVTTGAVETPLAAVLAKPEEILDGVASVQEIAVEHSGDIAATATGVLQPLGVTADVTSAINSQVNGSIQGALRDTVTASVDGLVQQVVEQTLQQTVEQTVSNSVNAAVADTVQTSVNQSIEQTLGGIVGGGR